MKIWIDLTNSPHVPFFDHMIRELGENHELLLTCRPLANTIELLEISGFPHYIVGKHYGQRTIKKVFGFIIRVLQLYKFLRNKGIDVAISHSSFYSPVVSRLLGIRCIYLNDNEHAQGNKISFLLADKIMVPEFLEIKKVKKQWAGEKKIVRYPGVKEGIYLWSYIPIALNNSDNPKNKQRIFIRPEPWTAQYYKGKRNFIDEFLISIRDKYEIILLPRGKLQEKYYRQDKFCGVIVPEKSMNLNEIMGNCKLFIGAGGTMTREAAVLGIPTISIYQDKLLDVDNYLIEKGCMIHNKNLDAAYVIDYLEQTAKRPPDKELLEKGKAAYQMIKNAILIIN
jgi:predicted glycosyltransferase